MLPEAHRLGLQDYHSESTRLKQGTVQTQACVLGVLAVLYRGYCAGVLVLLGLLCLRYHWPARLTSVRSDDIVS